MSLAIRPQWPCNSCIHTAYLCKNHYWYWVGPRSDWYFAKCAPHGFASAKNDDCRSFRVRDKELEYPYLLDFPRATHQDKERTHPTPSSRPLNNTQSA